MLIMNCFSKHHRPIRWGIIVLGAVWWWTAMTAAGEPPMINDIRILYLFENDQAIDWPLLHYMAEEKGCHIDMVTVDEKAPKVKTHVNAERYNLSLHRLGESAFPNTAGIFERWRPDLVILAEVFGHPSINKMAQSLQDIEYDSTRAFNIIKCFRRIDTLTENSVPFNAGQYFEQNARAIAEMSSSVFPLSGTVGMTDAYSIYEPIVDRVAPDESGPSFLAGLDGSLCSRISRLYNVQQAGPSDTAVDCSRYDRLIRAAAELDSPTRIDTLLAALDELVLLRRESRKRGTLQDRTAEQTNSIDKIMRTFHSAVLDEAGIICRGQTSLHDTPEGARLKFRLEIQNNGVVPVDGGRLEFQDGKTGSIGVIDSALPTIRPHNSFIREYAIMTDSADGKYLAEGDYVFTCHLGIKDHALPVRFEAGDSGQDEISVSLEPGFLIVKSFSSPAVDHLVVPAQLKAIIRKPSDFSDELRIDVTSQTNIKTGAYRRSIKPGRGDRTTELDIPMAVTRSIGDDIYPISISISCGDQQIASDTVFISKIDFEIPIDMLIALYPGSSGLIEEILLQAGADYRTISRHFLRTGDFHLYDAIIFGTDCFDNRDRPIDIKNKLERYVENGGRVVVFAQSAGWPSDFMPLAIKPRTLSTSEQTIYCNQPDHTLFGRRYSINPDTLLARIEDYPDIYPVSCFPAESIVESGDGYPLLCEWRTDGGTMIYCGLPVPQMISRLDRSAVGFFANLMYYLKDSD